MNREDDEPLWDILRHSNVPEISPFFARDVLRKTREEASAKAKAWRWLGWRSLVPATGLAVAVIGAVIVTHHPRSHGPAAPREYDPVASIDPQDYEVVADLDVLLTSEENNLWDDSSSL